VLLKLTTACNDVALTLLTTLNSIKVTGRHRRWKRVRRALKTQWNTEYRGTKSEIVDIQRRTDPPCNGIIGVSQPTE
jgi:hypothetical protein